MAGAHRWCWLKRRNQKNLAEKAKKKKTFQPENYQMNHEEKWQNYSSLEAKVEEKKLKRKTVNEEETKWRITTTNKNKNKVYTKSYACIYILWIYTVCRQKNYRKTESWGLRGVKNERKQQCERTHKNVKNSFCSKKWKLLKKSVMRSWLFWNANTQRIIFVGFCE